MSKWAVVCVYAYNNEVTDVDLFDNYEDAYKFMQSEAVESYEEMKEYNENIHAEILGSGAEIVIDGSTDYFWTIEPVNVH